MNITLPLDQMTTADKLSMMELLWDDLCRTPEELPTPAWHGEVLAERQRLVDEGKTKFIPFDEFSRRIREDTR